MSEKGKAIDVCYARKLVQNYVNKKIDTKLPLNETRAVWFQKELILEALGLDPGMDTGEISGLRFYLGAYEDHDGYPESDADYNKITLVMVKTGQDTIEVDRGTITETMYKDIIKDPNADPEYPDIAPPSTAEKTCYNEGQSIPPPPDGAGLGLINW